MVENINKANTNSIPDCLEKSPLCTLFSIVILWKKEAIKYAIKMMLLSWDMGRSGFVNMILSLIRLGKFMVKDVLFEPNEG